MAIPNGKPATDFSAMNREYIREVAKEEAASGGGIPAPQNPSNGDVLTYNSTSAKWEAANPPAAGIPAPASPSNGDVLTYNSTSEEWEAAAPSAGGNVPTPDLSEDWGKTIVVGDDGYELQYPYMLRELDCQITTNENISLPANSQIVFATVEADMTSYPDFMAMFENANCVFYGRLYALLPITQKIICNRFYTDENTPNSIFFDIIIFRTDASATESLNPSTVNMIITLIIETNE